ncbi:hypothetical protein [Actinocrispum wychmicini]|uniref:Uncharacterized protein n=1 Tax=Actinocrispum wychmicini TaxID=1213861 RepID=A0A4R2IRC0_9PSEU|nr:hypothetical protein [Actinocrispum wychmicini]TCO46699.1 hypothetical protein EV192_11894 [Actinocrispum wychmicini]
MLAACTVAAVPNELIRVRAGRAVLSDAVFKVADVLNPLGAAAKIVATLGACSIELMTMRSERQRLAAARDTALEVLKTRQGVIIGLFELNARESTEVSIDRREFRQVFREMSAASRDHKSADSFRVAAMGTVQIMSASLVNLHTAAGDRLVRLSDSLNLGNTRAAVEALRAIGR